MSSCLTNWIRDDKPYWPPSHCPAQSRLLRGLHGDLCLLKQQRLHVSEDEAHIERARAVDVPDRAFTIDKIHPQGVVERTGRISLVSLGVDRLAIGFKDGTELLAGCRRYEAPV